MLPVIQHHPENFARNIQFCAQCPDLDTRTGLCKGGIYHSIHCNGDYCPAGHFGKGKPANWPHAEHVRLDLCRACKMGQKSHCTKDGASFRDHAREGVCPVGKYLDGVTGNLPTPAPAPQPAMAAATTGEPKPRGCCGE